MCRQFLFPADDVCLEAYCNDLVRCVKVDAMFAIALPYKSSNHFITHCKFLPRGEYLASFVLVCVVCKLYISAALQCNPLITLLCIYKRYSYYHDQYFCDRKKYMGSMKTG